MRGPRGHFGLGDWSPVPGNSVQGLARVVTVGDPSSRVDSESTSVLHCPAASCAMMPTRNQRNHGIIVRFTSIPTEQMSSKQNNLDFNTTLSATNASVYTPSIS